MASEERPSNVLEIGGDFDLKTQKIGIKLKIPTSLLTRRWAWFEVPMRSWRLRWTARGDAKRNHPPTNSRSPQDHELQIVNLPKTKLKRLVDVLLEVIQEATDNINRLTPKEFDAERMKRQVTAKQEELEEYFQRTLKRLRSDWSEAGENERKQRGRLATFVENNNLDRDAEQKPFIRSLALMMIFFLIDGLANATLFAGASEMGFLGGLVIAFGLSAVNIGVGFMTGMFGIRNMFHVQTVWRVLGGIAVTIGALIGVSLNLFVAHFRDVAEASLRAAESGTGAPVVSVERIDAGPVMGAMLANPLLLHTLLSYLLLLSGLIVFIVGAREGYAGFGDPYPGYGERDKKWRDAKKAFQTIDIERDSKIGGAKAYIMAMYANVRSMLERAETMHAVRKDDIDENVTVLRELYRKAVNVENRLNEDALRLLSIYQRENSQFRLSQKKRRVFEKRGSPLSDPPARFDNDPEFPSLMPTIEEVEASAKQAKALIDRNLAGIKDVLLWLEGEARQASKRLETIQAQAKDEPMAA